MTARTLSKARLWIDDTPDLLPAQLQQRVRQLVEAHHITLMLVDLPFVIQPSVHGKWHKNRLQEFSDIHSSLKALAEELNIAVVVFTPLACPVVSQHAKRPQHTGPRENALEKAIDHVLFLYRDQPSELGGESKHVIIGRIGITKRQHGLVTEVDISI